MLCILPLPSRDYSTNKTNMQKPCEVSKCSYNGLGVIHTEKDALLFSLVIWACSHSLLWSAKHVLGCQQKVTWIEESGSTYSQKAHLPEAWHNQINMPLALSLIPTTSFITSSDSRYTGSILQILQVPGLLCSPLHWYPAPLLKIYLATMKLSPLFYFPLDRGHCYTLHYQWKY